VRKPVSSETRRPRTPPGAIWLGLELPFRVDGVRSVEQGLHFFLGQIRHQTMVGFLEGIAKNSGEPVRRRWLMVLQKPEERADGSQTDVRVSAELPRAVSRCFQE